MKTPTHTTANPIPSPAVLADQDCEYFEGTFEDEAPYYHAWSKLNDKGSHVMSFQKGSMRIMCIVKPAPWISPVYVRDLWQRLYRGE